MSVWFVVMSVFAALNPPRVALALAQTPRRDRTRALQGGVALAGLAVVVLAALGAWILNILEVTDETWRIAAGAVAVLSGAYHLSVRVVTPVPAITAPIHAVAPVAFPVVLVPEVVVLAVLYGATESFGVTLTAAALGLATVAVWGAAGAGVATRGAARLLAALLITVGIALIVMGIRDV